MSGHIMRVEWEDGAWPTHTIVCNEPPEAPCRAQFDCGCGEYADSGIGEDGLPWHELTDGYMDDDQREDAEQGKPPRHYGRHGGDCIYDLWINNSGCAEEMGTGSIDIPVTFTWDGDGYAWSVAEANGGAA